MKNLKKVFAILFTMIMTISVTVFASDNPKGNLTVKVNKNNTLENQTIKLYKLFDLTRSNEHYAYTINPEYKDILKTALQLTGDNLTNDDYYNAIHKMQKDSTQIQKFANDFEEKALKEKKVATTSKEHLLKDTKEVTFDNIDQGYYLIYQTGTQSIQSSLISLDQENVSVELKGEEPDIIKEENKENVDIGDVITYTITGVIPDTTGYEQYEYIIEDELSTGLTYIKDEDGKNVKVMIKDQIGIPTQAPDAIITGQKFELDLSEWVRKNQENKGKEFEVIYQAKVNEYATVKENNEAYLEYGDDPGSIIKTIPKEVKSPTYPLQIKKTDNSAEENMLSGAIFELYETKNDAINKTNAIKVTKMSDGMYVYDTNGSGTEMESINQKVSGVEEEYNLCLNGLKSGTDYYLAEIKAPDGYNRLSEPIKITIHKSANEEDETLWTITADNGEVNGQVLTVKNNTGTILPSTGGRGTILFSIIAAILILGVSISFIKDKKTQA